MNELDNNDQLQKSIAVIAIGNSLRSDDGIAQALIESLPAPLREVFAIADLGIHSSSIDEFISAYKVAVVLDASVACGSPGKVQILELDLNGELSKLSFVLKLPKSTHGLSLVDEIAISRLAGRTSSCSRVLLFTVEILDVSYGSCLSDELAEQFPAIRCKLLELLDRLRELSDMRVRKTCATNSSFMSKKHEVCSNNA